MFFITRHHTVRFGRNLEEINRTHSRTFLDCSGTLFQSINLEKTKFKSCSSTPGRGEKKRRTKIVTFKYTQSFENLFCRFSTLIFGLQMFPVGYRVVFSRRFRIRGRKLPNPSTKNQKNEKTKFTQNQKNEKKGRRL